MKILDQFLELMKYATVNDESDYFQLPDDHSLLTAVNSIVTKENVVDVKKMHKQYLTLGSMFKLLKVSMHKSDGSFLKFLLNFPYFTIFYEKLESEANLFLSKPISKSLSAAWNITVIFE